MLLFFAQKIAVKKANKTTMFSDATKKNHTKPKQQFFHFSSSKLRKPGVTFLLEIFSAIFTDFKCAKKVVSGVKLHLKSPDDDRNS